MTTWAIRDLPISSPAQEFELPDGAVILDLLDVTDYRRAEKPRVEWVVRFAAKVDRWEQWRPDGIWYGVGHRDCSCAPAFDSDNRFTCTCPHGAEWEYRT